MLVKIKCQSDLNCLEIISCSCMMEYIFHFASQFEHLMKRFYFIIFCLNLHQYNSRQVLNGVVNHPSPYHYWVDKVFYDKTRYVSEHEKHQYTCNSILVYTCKPFILLSRSGCSQVTAVKRKVFFFCPKEILSMFFA